MTDLKSNEQGGASTSANVEFNASPVERYQRAEAAFLEARNRVADSRAALAATVEAAAERVRVRARTYEIFALVFAMLSILALHSSTQAEQPLIPVSLGLAWFLPGAICVLLTASATLRYRSLGAQFTLAARENSLMGIRRRWLATLRDLATNNSGRVADSVATKAEGHLKADQVLETQAQRRLPWPGRSLAFGSADGQSDGYPFVADLLRWLTGFVAVLATIFLMATTLVDFRDGMAANGTALIVMTGLRLGVTQLAIAGRKQRLLAMSMQSRLRAAVLSQDDQVLRDAKDLTEPPIDLRQPEAATV